MRHWKLTAQVNKKVIHPSSTAIHSALDKLIEQFRISWNWKRIMHNMYDNEKMVLHMHIALFNMYQVLKLVV